MNNWAELEYEIFLNIIQQMFSANVERKLNNSA